MSGLRTDAFDATSGVTNAECDIRFALIEGENSRLGPSIPIGRSTGRQFHPDRLWVECGTVTCLTDADLELNISKSVGAIEDVLLKGHCANYCAGNPFNRLRPTNQTPPPTASASSSGTSVSVKTAKR
jgi:hypothetical protein